jgi:transposase
MDGDWRDGFEYAWQQPDPEAGEVVLDIPATLAARVRVLWSGQSNKNDPNDARSVAIAAMHAPMLAAVPVEDHRTVLRLLAKNHTDLARWRNKICCRLHALVAELVAGGISKEVVVSDAFALLESIHPEGVAAIGRHRLAGQLADELVHVDDQLKLAKANIRTAVAASGTTLTDIFGIGPVVAAMLIGYTGDPFRFPTSATTPPTRAPPRSSCPRPGASCTACRGAGTGGSTARCTLSRSPRSVTPTAPAVATTTPSAPKARHHAKRSAP